MKYDYTYGFHAMLITFDKVVQKFEGLFKF